MSTPSTDYFKPDHIRRRPSMYIGSTDEHGLHLMLFGMLYNILQEADAGWCDQVEVELQPGGGCRVTYNGRGIRVDEARESVILDPWLTPTSHRWYAWMLRCVCALSEECVVDLSSDGRRWCQVFLQGIPLDSVSEVSGVCLGSTTIGFRPDRTIFQPGSMFNFDRVADRLRQACYLMRGLTIRLLDSRGPGKLQQTFGPKVDIRHFVRHLNRKSDPVHSPVVYIHREAGQQKLQLAMQWVQEDANQIHTFANFSQTIHGGTHLDGLNRSLTRLLKRYGRDHGIFGDESLTLDDSTRGLTAVLSIRVDEPILGGSFASILQNPEMTPFVRKAIHSQFAFYLERHPDAARAICERVLTSYRARQQAMMNRRRRREAAE
jgi:DNA gyrase subunit B